jgi:hypothetical protein
MGFTDRNEGMFENAQKEINFDMVTATSPFNKISSVRGGKVPTGAKVRIVVAGPN